MINFRKGLKALDPLAHHFRRDLVYKRLSQKSTHMIFRLVFRLAVDFEPTTVR